MIVTLIGYRGCGKSTVGPLLASRLRCRCVDTDDIVEQRAKKTIAEIFAADGEPKFRSLESDVLKELLADSQIVIAAGGGAILAEDNRRRMKAAGCVVWLRAAPERLARRMSSDETSGQRRPSLTGKAIEDEVTEVLEYRSPLYRDAATMVVDTDDLTPEEICSRIVDLLPLGDSEATS